MHFYNMLLVQTPQSWHWNRSAMSMTTWAGSQAQLCSDSCSSQPRGSQEATVCTEWTNLQDLTHLSKQTESELQQNRLTHYPSPTSGEHSMSLHSTLLQKPNQVWGQRKKKKNPLRTITRGCNSWKLSRLQNRLISLQSLLSYTQSLPPW